jgi:hypothetical protein
VVGVTVGSIAVGLGTTITGVEVGTTTVDATVGAIAVNVGWIGVKVGTTTVDIGWKIVEVGITSVGAGWINVEVGLALEGAVGAAAWVTTSRGAELPSRDDTPSRSTASVARIKL